MIEAERAQVDLQVAGGIKREHIPALVKAGASTLALGGGLYRVDDMAAEVQSLRQAATQARFRRGLYDESNAGSRADWFAILWSGFP